MNRSTLHPVLLFLLLLPALAGAEEELPFDVFIVPPQPISGLEIRWVDLLGEGARIPAASRRYGPFHGELTPTAEGFHYAARPSLWEAKIDGFVLDYVAERERRAINVVVAVGEAHKGESEHNSFDHPVTGDPDWHLEDPAGMVEVVDSALWVTGTAREDGYVYYVVEDGHLKLPALDLYDGIRSHPGSSTTGSGTGVLLNPPSAGNRAATGSGSSEQVFFAAGPVGLADSLKAGVRQAPDGLHVRIEAADETGVWHESAWVDVKADRPNRLDVEYDHPPNDLEIVRLKINGKVAATLELEAGDLPHHLEEHRIGGMEPAAGLGHGLGLEFDDGEVYRYIIHPEEEPRRAEDFEGGGTVDWTGSSGSGLALAVRGNVGRTWLEAGLSHGDSFLVDATPEAISRARLLFDLDPSALHHGSVKVLALHGADDWNSANEYLQVLFQMPAQVQVRIKDEVWHSTGWLRISELGAVRVELTLRDASAPGAGDGELRVRLHGDELAVIDGLTNSQQRLETVRFGAMSVEPNRADRIYFDNFQLWAPHVAEPCGSLCDP